MLKKEEIKSILIKPYLTTADLAALSCCKISKAYLIKKEIESKVISEGRKVINCRFIAVKDVLDYLDNDYYNHIYQQLLEDHNE